MGLFTVKKSMTKLLNFDSAQIMGILNVTPDSFSDGGEFFSPDDAIQRGLEIAEEGADIIDIGAESTRPGAEAVSADEEIRRLSPVVEELVKRTDTVISIDTTKASVAREMLQKGGDLINDISGLKFDPDLAGVVAEFGCPVILMHIQGTPRTMQENPSYGDVIEDILQYFKDQIDYARSQGIADEQILIDPGIGFGKTVEHNYRIIKDLRQFTLLGFPVVVGASRKSFIGKTLDLPVGERLEGSLAVAALSIWNGAAVLRVHDVKETKEAISMVDAIRNAGMTG